MIPLFCLIIFIESVFIYIYLLSAHYYIFETTQKEVMILLELKKSKTLYFIIKGYCQKPL